MQTIKTIFSIGFLLIFQGYSSSVHAEYMTRSEMNYVIQSMETEIVITQDFRQVFKQKTVYKILNQEGISDLSSKSFYYDSGYSNVRILEAFTQTKGKKTYTSSKDMETLDAPNPYGWSSQKRIRVPFLQVSVGSEIHVDVETTYYNEANPRNLWNILSYEGEYFEKAALTIQSELPMRYKLQDPTRHVRFKEWKDGDLYRASLNLDIPTSFALKDEYRGSFSANEAPNFYYGIKQTWDEALKKDSEKYYQVIDEKIPDVFSPVLRQAKKEKTKLGQIEVIGNFVTKNFSYQSDHRLLGGYIPRPLAEISRRKTGDCKDKTLLFIALLKSLGITAEPALLHSSKLRDFPMELPLEGSATFNHVIAHVELNGKHYFTDLTSDLFDLTFPGSNNYFRESAVLGREQVRIMKIPTEAPGEMKEFWTIDMEKSGAGLLVKNLARREGAHFRTMVDYYEGVSESRIQHAVKQEMNYLFTGASFVRMVKKDRKVKLIPKESASEFNFTYEANLPLNYTTKGKGLMISFFTLPLEKFLGPEKVTSFTYDYNVDTFEMFIRPKFMEIEDFSGIEGCARQSDYFDYYIRGEKEGVRAYWKIKRRYIPNKDVLSKEFQKTAKEMKDCMSNYIVIF